MSQSFFAFKRFVIHQDACAMKVSTDACLFGAWCAQNIANEKQAMQNVLDIGTGSGLLSLMAAQKNDVLVDAVEVDSAAARQAMANVNASPFSKKICVVNQSILDFEGTRYHSIICNPPFYESQLTSPVTERATAHHAGGLLWKQLIPIIKNKLLPQGHFYLLIPFQRLKDMELLLNNNQLYAAQHILISHSKKHAISRVLIKGSQQKTRPQTALWTIKEGVDYTPIFKNLLQDYYLNL